MTEKEMLIREWVEVREESESGRIVLRPTTFNIPPARGRRRLDLSVPGGAVAKSPGPTDKLESETGTWTVTDDILNVAAPGWTGTYRVEQLTADKLVLVPK